MQKILETHRGFEGHTSSVDLGGGTGAVVDMIVSKGICRIYSQLRELTLICLVSLCVCMPAVGGRDRTRTLLKTLADHCYESLPATGRWSKPCHQESHACWCCNVDDLHRWGRQDPEGFQGFQIIKVLCIQCIACHGIPHEGPRPVAEVDSGFPNNAFWCFDCFVIELVYDIIWSQ